MPCPAVPRLGRFQPLGFSLRIPLPPSRLRPRGWRWPGNDLRWISVHGLKDGQLLLG